VQEATAVEDLKPTWSAKINKSIKIVVKIIIKSVKHWHCFFPLPLDAVKCSADGKGHG